MMNWRSVGRACRVAVFLCLVSALLAAEAHAQRVVALADEIAESLSRIEGDQYRTIAFSRIAQAGGRINVDELIDFTNVKIVQKRRLRVIDRSKLELILKEQQIQLSDFVSAEKYQELGKLIGVDLFLYGTYYRDALVLKAIDVQNSAIAWADVFADENASPEAGLLKQLSDDMLESLRKDVPRFKAAEIENISFWDVTSDGGLDPRAVMDFLAMGIAKQLEFKVIDRENIALIAKEQQLNQAVFINQENAKRLGQLYGVDAFIYGGISRRPDGTFIASLKMMNIFNGVLEWADLLTVRPGGMAATASNAVVSPEQPGMILVTAGPFVMGTDSKPREARPAYELDLPAFHIDRTEVSNEDYAAFVKERGYRKPPGWQGNTFPRGAERLPVVTVSWHDATQYCRFKNKRLPSEAEWEKAARGTSGQPYPWQGRNFYPNYTVTRESGRSRPVPVDQAGKDVSPYGILHMAGNVREWVDTVFAPYPGATTRNPKYDQEIVVRGGSWATNSATASAYFRGSSDRNLGWPDVGFRCAKDAR